MVVLFIYLSKRPYITDLYWWVTISAPLAVIVRRQFSSQRQSARRSYGASAWRVRQSEHYVCLLRASYRQSWADMIMACYNRDQDRSVWFCCQNALRHVLTVPPVHTCLQNLNHVIPDNWCQHLYTYVYVIYKGNNGITFITCQRGTNNVCRGIDADG